MSENQITNDEVKNLKSKILAALDSDNQADFDNVKPEFWAWRAKNQITDEASADLQVLFTKACRRFNDWDAMTGGGVENDSNKPSRKSLFDSLDAAFDNSDISDEEKQKLKNAFDKIQKQKVNILITGATGCGKSSTIDALFGTEVSKIGVGADPETQEIKKYELENLVLWDSPGLGDGKDADKRHSANIIRKITEKDSDGNFLIDLVLVILDGSVRDLGTSYDLINDVIIPNLGENKKDRILIAINQADMAMKGRYWNQDSNCPEPELTKFLNEKAESVKRRIKEATGVEVEPIYYSAGYKDIDQEQQQPFNLAKLLYYILDHVPEEKRLIIVDKRNSDEEAWNSDDGTAPAESDDISDNIEESPFVKQNVGTFSVSSSGTSSKPKQQNKSPSHSGGWNNRVNSTTINAVKTVAKKTLGEKFVAVVKKVGNAIGNAFKSWFGSKKKK